jgi:hypothetical protein
MAAQVQGGDAAAMTQPQPTREMKDQWARNLAANWGQADAAARTEIARMPLTWAAIRMLWPGLSEVEKSQARAQWAQSNEVRQVAEVINAMRPRQPAHATVADATGHFAQGTTTHATSAAELMAERTREYEFTKSMLNMGYNNTIMQMAAMSGNRWRYK